MTVDMDQRISQELKHSITQAIKQEIKKNKEIIITRLELINS